MVMKRMYPVMHMERIIKVFDGLCERLNTLVLFCGNVKGSNGSNHSARPMNSKSHVLTSTRYAV